MSSLDTKSSSDNAAAWTPAFKAMIAAAKALKQGDRDGARAVMAEAILAEMDPLMAGELFSEIKASAGIPIGDLRKQFEKMMSAQRTGVARAQRVLPFAIYDRTADPRSLADILDEVADLISARVSCSDDDVTVAALWSVGTWGVREGSLPGQEADALPGPPIYPRLRIGSGGPGSGKSTLLETLKYVVARAIWSDSITASSFFRLIDAHQPTLLLDEVDAWVNGNEDIRKVINSGHHRAGMVIISTKDTSEDDSDWEPTIFRTFAPVALAGLGALAGTIEDRSLTIMLTKSPGFESRRVSERHLIAFRERVAPHLAAHGETIAKAMDEGIDWTKRQMPNGLANRAADNWEPLLVLAKLAGRQWLRRALTACIRSVVDPKKARSLTKSEHLLADFYAYHRTQVQSRWDARRAARARTGQQLTTSTISSNSIPQYILSTSEFIEWLSNTPGYASPWAEGVRRDPQGRSVSGPTPHGIARVMKSFNVKPSRRDLWSKGFRKNEVTRGYLVSELRPLWRSHGSRNAGG